MTGGKGGKRKPKGGSHTNWVQQRNKTVDTSIVIIGTQRDEGKGRNFIEGTIIHVHDPTRPAQQAPMGGESKFSMTVGNTAQIEKEGPGKSTTHILLGPKRSGKYQANLKGSKTGLKEGKAAYQQEGRGSSHKTNCRKRHYSRRCQTTFYATPARGKTESQQHNGPQNK